MKVTLCDIVLVERERLIKKRFPTNRLSDHSTEMVDVGAMVGVTVGRVVGE